MRKDSWKFIGIESLYLFVVLVVFVLCSYIQLLGLIDTGRTSGGIFGGVIYAFNPLIYVSGVVVAVLVTHLCNRYILKGCLELLPDTKIWAKIIYFILAGVFCAASFICMIMVYLFKFGLGAGVSDEILSNITLFVWPAIELIYMVVVFIIYVGKEQPELKIEVIKPLATTEDDIESLDDIMQGIDYIKEDKAEVEDREEVKEEDREETKEDKSETEEAKEEEKAEAEEAEAEEKSEVEEAEAEEKSEVEEVKEEEKEAEAAEVKEEEKEAGVAEVKEESVVGEEV